MLLWLLPTAVLPFFKSLCKGLVFEKSELREHYSRSREATAVRGTHSTKAVLLLLLAALIINGSVN